MHLFFAFIVLYLVCAIIWHGLSAMARSEHPVRTFFQGILGLICYGIIILVVLIFFWIIKAVVCALL